MQSEPVKLETGPITHAEARQMVARFNASHWNDGREKARYTIPADPRRDDDIRLHAYIDQMEALTARATAAEAENARWKEIAADELAETKRLIDALGVHGEIEGGSACMDAMLARIFALTAAESRVRELEEALTRLEHWATQYIMAIEREFGAQPKYGSGLVGSLHTACMDARTALGGTKA